MKPFYPYSMQKTKMLHLHPHFFFKFLFPHANPHIVLFPHSAHMHTKKSSRFLASSRFNI